MDDINTPNDKKADVSKSTVVKKITKKDEGEHQKDVSKSVIVKPKPDPLSRQKTTMDRQKGFDIEKADLEEDNKSERLDDRKENKYKLNRGNTSIEGVKPIVRHKDGKKVSKEKGVKLTDSSIHKDKDLNSSAVKKEGAKKDQ